jgi:hypothetical protein
MLFIQKWLKEYKLERDFKSDLESNGQLVVPSFKLCNQPTYSSLQINPSDAMKMYKIT